MLITGSVPDVVPYLAQLSVSVAPLLTARGIQNKVLEALAAGLPVVTTGAVFEGLPQVARAGCVWANDARAIAAALIELLQHNPDALRERAALADLSSLSWERQLGPLLIELEAAARSRLGVCA